MSKVVQKVDLDATSYRKNIQKLATDTKKETDKVNNALNESGNSVRDFNDRVEKATGESKKSFQDLFKSIKGGIGALGLAGLGAAIGGFAVSSAKEAGALTDTVNRISVRTGQNEFEREQFRNRILDVGTRTNVDQDQIAAAAENAIAFGASTDEAIKFAEVIAKTAKVFEDVDPSAFSEQIARDIRARGEEVTADAAKRSIEALIVGTRQGLGDIEQSFQAVSALPGRVQERAGLSQRDLVNLFAGGQGVAADPQLVNEAVRSLIKATDSIESRAAVQGILGTQLRDAQGKFTLTANNLDDIARRLDGIGDEAQQRAVLESIPGFSPEAVEGILSLVKDRLGFQRERERANRDKPKLEDAFERATDGFLENVSSFFNTFGNAFLRDNKFEQKFGKGGRRIGLSDEQIEAAKIKTSSLSLPGDATKEESATKKQQDRKPAALSTTEQTVKVLIEVDSKDPGFIAVPKSTDLSTTPGGL